MFCKIKTIDEVGKLAIGMMLAMIGGSMDVYSYTVHGKVFATGQTGNFVLVGVELIQKNYAQMLHAFVPIISFWLGVFIACRMLYYFKDKQTLWEYGILLTELIIVFIVGFIPCSYPDIIANSLVSLAASLQFCAFRKFGTGGNYSSVFCTGNMRSCAENFYKGIVEKDKKCMRSALEYFFILISFFIGVVSGAFEATILHEKAIWCVNLAILSILVFSYALNSSLFENKE